MYGALSITRDVNEQDILERNSGENDITRNTVRAMQ